MGTRKDSFEIYTPFGQAPSKRFACPALGPRAAHVNKPEVPVVSKIIQFYICVNRMPIRDASTMKYAGGNVVMDRENCGWDRHVGQFPLFFLSWRNSSWWATASLSRLHDHTLHSVGLLWTIDQPVAETST
jgi:hypothetical protein